MHWYEWVFSGIGVLILGYFVQSWTRSGEGKKAKLMAEGAKVTHSPVASGSGITQSINETHHHHYGPSVPVAVERQLAAPEAEPEPVQPRPNLAIVGVRKIFVHQGLDGAFYQSEPGRSIGEAVVVNVTNDALPGATNIGAIVKATVIYEDDGQELLRGMGTWLGEGSGMVQFRVDDSHSVILGLVINRQLSVPTKRRVPHGVGHVSFPTDPNPLNCERASVRVRLTNANTGELYCEEPFEIRASPLSISGRPAS
jgi:hypothetical protein